MIETPRLGVRPFVADDLDRFRAIRADDVVVHRIGGWLSSCEFAAQRLQRYIDHQARCGFAFGAVSLKPSTEIVGWGGLQHLDDGDEIEVGYGFAGALWGRGLATELASGWMRFGFDRLGLERIVAMAQPENLASRRVMEKLGMRHERNCLRYGIDSVYYAVTREAFAAIR